MNSMEYKVLTFSVGFYFLIYGLLLTLYPHTFSIHTYISFISFPIFFIIGLLISRYVFFYKPIEKNNLSDFNLDKKINEYGLIFMIITLWIIAIYSIENIFQYGILYREIYTTESQRIFGNVFISYFFKNFYIYLAYFLLIRFLCLKNISLVKKFSIMLLTLLPLSIITLGRFPTYEIIFFSIVIVFFGDGRNVKKILIASIVFALTISTAVFSLKVSSENVPLFLIVEEIFFDYFVNYHFIGFYFVDWVVENNALFLSKNYPCNSLGFLEDFFIYFFENLYGSDLGTSCMRHNGDFFTKGIHIAELDGRYNTFITNITPLYIDGGIAGVMLGGLFYGLLAGIKKSNTQIISPILLLSCLCLFFGVFMPKFSDQIYFLFFIYLLLYKIFLNIISLVKTKQNVK